MKERISEYMSRYLRRDKMLAEDALSKLESKILGICDGSYIEVEIGDRMIETRNDDEGFKIVTLRNEGSPFPIPEKLMMLDTDEIEWLADNYTEIIGQFEEKVLPIKEEKNERMNKRMNAVKKLEKAMEE